MWDGTLTARVKDRKMNEILAFAAMVKVDPPRRGLYMGIIEALNDDIDVCEELIASEGACSPSGGVIAAPEYRSRLSKAESADEDIFNSYKSAEPETVVAPADDGMVEYVRDLIERSLSDRGSVQDESLREAVESLKEELSACRERIERMSVEAEYAASERAALEERIAEMTMENGMLESRLSALRSRVEAAEAAVPEAEDEPVLETAVEEPVATTEEVEVVETPVEEEPRPIYDRILNEAQLEILDSVVEMKSAKLDAFIDMELSGEMREDVCEDIITFLKVDLAICRDLQGMDYTDRSSIEDGFIDILDVLEDSPDPAHQHVYVNSLTDEEKIVEDGYNRLMEHIQDVMIQRYTYLTE